MPDIQYIGENLLPRQIGHLGVVLSFVAALLAAISYSFSTNQQNKELIGVGATSWRSLGRWSFGVHGVSVLTIIGSIFYVMINKRFEYFYAHSHVDTDLEFRYVFAAFWEGQEGSFLLWMFWHVGLGAFIILRGVLGKKSENVWESPVLGTLAMIQVFLSSMILGLHFGWGEHIIKWGSNPILLLREANDAPIFAQADYVEKIKNSAKGLNPLLQNYWMTIHPPTLFLGFASTSIPFCYAIAGLWTKKYTEWLRPALPFALFSGTILGTGILMGGVWAYEALSFNGYWAWDPVENMSLVPWIVLVAGIHTNLISRATGQSLRATFAFYIGTFLLILYSTFLTRSGVLGDTSVHAFSEIGLEWQLVLFQTFFMGLSGYFFVKNYRHIPNPLKEEAISSREFWMFIGSLVLLLSVVFISFTTSIPVFNKVIGYFNPSFKKMTAPVDVVAHYNKTQLWIGVFMGLLSATAQFLRYKEFNFASYRVTLGKHLGVSLLLSLVLTGLCMQWISATAWQFVLLLFAGIFTTVSNGSYIVSFLRKNLSAAGSPIAHLGFGLLLVGIMASGIDKRWISSNRFAMEGLINFSEDQFNKNILLMKGSPMFMNGYQVIYEGDTTYGLRRDFTLKFRRLDTTKMNTVRIKGGLMPALDSFTTHPHILYAKNTGKIASTNPDTKHYWNYDIFTHVASLPPSEQDPELAHAQEDSLKYVEYSLATDEAIFPKITLKQTPQYSVKIEGLDMNPKHPKYIAEEKDVAVGVKLAFMRGKDTVYRAEPIVLLRGENVYQLPVTVNELGIRVKAESAIFDKIFVADKDLKYSEYVFKQGETKQIGSKTVTFQSVEPNPEVKGFKIEPNDLSFAANLKVTEGGVDYAVAPVYVIRGTQPIPLKDEIPALGMNFVISKVDPDTREMHFKIAESDPKLKKTPISIAENAERNDFVVLEATINPGINLVWVGSLLMIFGLGMAMVFRIRKG